MRGLHDGGHGLAVSFSPPDDHPGASTPITVRVLKHELRTPINHIMGYSEMLREDLGDAISAADRLAIDAIHATGRDLLAVTNAAFGGASDPDTLATPETRAALREAVDKCLQTIVTHRLDDSPLARVPAFAGDVRKIVRAIDRLVHFARTGEIVTTDPPPAPESGATLGP